MWSFFNRILRNWNVEVIVDVVFDLFRDVDGVVFLIEGLVEGLRIELRHKAFLVRFAINLVGIILPILRFLRFLLLQELGFLLIMLLLSLLEPLIFLFNRLLPLFFEARLLIPPHLDILDPDFNRQFEPSE